MNIYIIRHGETAFNVGEIRIRGRNDVPLSDLGLLHTEETGKALADIPLEKIFIADFQEQRLPLKKLRNIKRKLSSLKNHFFWIYPLVIGKVRL